MAKLIMMLELERDLQKDLYGFEKEKNGERERERECLVRTETDTISSCYYTPCTLITSLENAILHFDCDHSQEKV